MTGEGGHRRGDHDRRDILRHQRRAPRIHAEPFQHADQTLLGEYGVAQAVAGTVVTDHQTVADQQVGADAFEIRDVPNSRTRARRACRKRNDQIAGRKGEGNDGK